VAAEGSYEVRAGILDLVSAGDEQWSKLAMRP
jgi:hypothetical protein